MFQMGRGRGIREKGKKAVRERGRGEGGVREGGREEGGRQLRREGEKAAPYLYHHQAEVDQPCRRSTCVPAGKPPVPSRVGDERH